MSVSSIRLERENDVSGECFFLPFSLDWAKINLFDGESRNIVPLSLFTAAFRWQLSDDLIEFDDEEVSPDGNV